jgi:branched-chain amino acid transport system permease protein
VEELFFRALVSGISIGLVYGIVAIGMLLVFSVTSVINLSHGDGITIGMYLALIAVAGLHLPYWSVLLIVPVLGFLVGNGMFLIGYRPFSAQAGRSAGHEALLMIFISTLALSLAIEGGLNLLVPSEGSGFAPVLPLHAYQFGPVLIAPSDLLLAGVSIVVAILVTVFLRFTQIGRSMRAIAENTPAASLQGINTQRISALGWALSGAIAALAGVLLGPNTVLTPFAGGGYLFIAFAAAVLGGFGSIPGALLGGLLLGLSQQFFAAFVSAGWSSTVAFAFLLIVLMVRPQGLFGFSVTRV